MEKYGWKLIFFKLSSNIHHICSSSFSSRFTFVILKAQWFYLKFIFLFPNIPSNLLFPFLKFHICWFCLSWQFFCCLFSKNMSCNWSWLLHLLQYLSRLMWLWHLSPSVNSNLQIRMGSHPMGLHVWFLVRFFIYFYTLNVRTAKAVVRLRKCAVSPEPSLFAYAKSTIISWAGSFNTGFFYTHP